MKIIRIKMDPNDLFYVYRYSPNKEYPDTYLRLENIDSQLYATPLPQFYILEPRSERVTLDEDSVLLFYTHDLNEGLILKYMTDGENSYANIVPLLRDHDQTDVDDEEFMKNITRLAKDENELANMDNPEFVTDRMIDWAYDHRIPFEIVVDELGFDKAIRRLMRYEREDRIKRLRAEEQTQPSEPDENN